MNAPVPLRPHHGLCACFFQGKGYSEAFAANMARVLCLLRKNPAQEIRLSCGADLLCAACPHCVSGVCETAEKTERYDRACLKACGLQDGGILPWEKYSQLILKNILLPGRRETVCGDCGWNEICQQPIVE